MFEEVEKATFSQDVNEHWDISIGGLRVDVKGIKRVSRAGEKDDRFHWVEIQNVLGRRGWLYGKADFIAFELSEDWLVVDRLELVSWIERVVEKTYADFPLYKLKSRPNRKDIITLVKSADLQEVGIKVSKNAINPDSNSDQAPGKTRLTSRDLLDLFVCQGKRFSSSLFS